jgi:hypothetical protein
MATPRNGEWLGMDELRPPVYVCLQRTRTSDGSFPPFELDGRYATVSPVATRSDELPV